jgi:hypothetical protein
MEEVEQEALWRADDMDNYAEEVSHIADRKVTFSCGLQVQQSVLEVCGNPLVIA